MIIVINEIRPPKPADVLVVAFGAIHAVWDWQKRAVAVGSLDRPEVAGAEPVLGHVCTRGSTADCPPADAQESFDRAPEQKSSLNPTITRHEKRPEVSGPACAASN